MSVDTVSLADSPKTLRVRFIVGKKMASAKAPTHQALVSLPAPLQGASMNLTIFRGNQGEDPEVAVPAIYGTASIQVEPQRVETGDGRVFFVASTEDEDGRKNLDRLLVLVQAKFLDWRLATPRPSEYEIHL